MPYFSSVHVIYDWGVFVENWWGITAWECPGAWHQPKVSERYLEGYLSRKSQGRVRRCLSGCTAVAGGYERCGLLSNSGLRVSCQRNSMTCLSCQLIRRNLMAQPHSSKRLPHTLPRASRWSKDAASFLVLGNQTAGTVCAVLHFNCAFFMWPHPIVLGL